MKKNRFFILMVSNILIFAFFFLIFSEQLFGISVGNIFSKDVPNWYLDAKKNHQSNQNYILGSDSDYYNLAVDNFNHDIKIEISKELLEKLRLECPAFIKGNSGSFIIQNDKKFFADEVKEKIAELQKSYDNFLKTSK